MRWTLIAALVLLLSPAVRAEEPPGGQIDLLAFSNGALIERSSTPYDDSWSPLWLLDEETTTGWASQDGAKPPFEVVVSLPEQSRFTRFAFDTLHAESPERSAKTIDVFVSDQSSTAGFAKVMSVTLAPAKDGQSFDVPAQTPATGRWVRFVLTANHGDDKYLEVMNLHGYGTQMTNTPLPTVSGTYESASYGRFHLAQSGAQLTGCYEFKEGLVQGGLESHLMRLTWNEEKGAKSGPAVMVATRDGKGFQGLWRMADGSDSWHDNWKLRKISNDIGSCPHWKPPTASTSLVADQLATTGRVRLYGINFDTDSDRLRPDATPTLEQLKTALQANAAWRLTVEGHTDSTSTAAHNQDLSARRAAAVKAYLVAAGVGAARLETAGFGQDKPVAPNETSLGRAQNRRVEVVRQ